MGGGSCTSCVPFSNKKIFLCVLSGSSEHSERARDKNKLLKKFFSASYVALREI